MGKIDENIGLSSYYALGTLHDDIQKLVREHTLNKNSKWQTARNVLSISNKFSTFNWLSFMCAVLVGGVFILTSFFVDADIYGNLLGHGIFVIGLGGINVFLILWDDSLRENEILLRLNGLLQLIKECQERYVWTPENYPHLCSPYSPCITLQWTYRDGRIVNLPWALLCRGDTIVLRPGQPAPGNCSQLGDASCFLSCGEIYSPPVKHDHISLPTARVPFCNKRFVLQETPILKNIREVLERNTRRNFSSYDDKRHSIMTSYIQFLALPFLFGLTLAISLLQYGFVNKWVATGHWTVMFLLLPALVCLPLLNLGFPVTWLVLNTFGNAKLSAFLQSGAASELSDINHSNSADPFEDISIIGDEVQNIIGGVKWGQHFLHSLFGTQHSLTLTRSSNPLHVLGSVTALACVDKKGILSWPNPTAEKVFFLKTRSGKPSIARNNTAEQSVTEGVEDTVDEPPQIVHRKASRQQDHYTAIEVLDLTHDLSCPFKLEFDDTQWQEHLSSLKPIGLAIMLNTCNMSTQEHYVQFCSHVTCEAMYNEDLVPVTNRRCLCELSKQIGFSENAKKSYKLLEQLSTFRHVQPDTVRKDIKFARSLALATKLKLPFPHMVAVVTCETHSPNSLQLFSQATGDIALDSCVDFWDGSALRTLTSSDRKKILDFYQRTSLTAYCTAFAYRPLGKAVNPKMSRIYMELPADSHNLYMKNRSPTPVDWDFHHSSDSLFGNESLKGEVNEIEDCFEIQCNQIFLGMVTMQYQAQIEMVQLIEQLERACIRFVHFSKENELRSRVFSEKMGLESGWNCHISLLSSGDASTDDGVIEEEIEMDDGKCNESDNAASPLLVDNLCGSLEGSRTMSLSAPGAINYDRDFVETSKAVKPPEDEVDLGSQEGWQSLSCLTDSTEQSAPINFDMSNRAKLPRGIDQIRPHLEKVDNVPLLVSLFTDCTPSTTEEMIEIMQDYDEIVCVMGSSASADNNSIFLKANASVSVEPLYPQVCQQVPVFSVPSDIISPVQLSQRLNSLPCSVSITKQRPISLFHLIMHARHFMQCLWNSVQFWICSVVSVSLLQIINTMILLPPLFTAGQIIWLSCVVIPAMAISLVNAPTNPQAMQRPGYKTKLKVNYEVIIFVLWCYGTKFLPSLLLVPIIYGASLNSHCLSLAIHNSTNVSTCTLVYPYPHKPWGGWEEHSAPLVTSQMLAFTVFTVHLVMVSVSFVHREYLCWKRSPIRNRTWLATVSCILLIQTLYPLMVAYLSPIDDDESTRKHYYLRTPWIAVILAIISPLIVFIVNESIKWQEIRANLRSEKRARLDFGTKLGMNSPF